MTKQSEALRQARETVLQHAQKLAPKNASFAHFLTLSANSMDDEDFAGLGAGELEAILTHSYTRLGRRETGEHLINIWLPEDGIGDGVQIIDIFVDNMPFLVDSVMGAVRGMGGNIRRIAHPILPVEPGKSGLQVLEQSSTASSRESFLHIHIDPIGDEETLAAMFSEIDSALTEVRNAVLGWRPMLERLRSLVNGYREYPPQIAENTLAETLHFLAWLADHNFTFLGMREYKLMGTGAAALLTPISDSGLGILSDPDYKFLRSGDDMVEMTAQHMEFLQSDDPLMVTKANSRARVHRRTYMDYVGVKLFGPTGELTGELRIIGLFTSQSLTTPHTEVPLLRRKISNVMRRSGFDPQSHAGKALMAALDTYPREELFQISEEELFEFACTIATLPDRPRIRVLPRIDRFDNFVSVLTYLPREKYSGDIRESIGLYLADVYHGRVSAFYPHFLEGDLVRVHFIIGRSGGETPRPDRAELEDKVTNLATDFSDQLREAADDPASIADYLNAFPAGYQSEHNHLTALKDIAAFQQIGQSDAVIIKLSQDVTADEGDDDADKHAVSLSFYHYGSSIPLSARVPLLENFGFSVIDERTYEIRPADGVERFVHDMLVRPNSEDDTPLAFDADMLEAALMAVWENRAESDGFNQLTPYAHIAWDDVALLRALGRYLKQAGIQFSQRYLWTALANHPEIARQLVHLFHTLHQPDFEGNRDQMSEALSGKILNALDDISSADEDLIIRHYLNLITVTLRTNFYQRDDNGNRRPALALKFDSQHIDGLPEPRPYREISVYSPEVEGVHLRGGEIARGGLRWSDRPEDFRTEILGLVKAQMVKNAVIVPVGAKGGFVPKSMPQNPDRETFMSVGTAAYKTFIGTLLDVTDNLDGDTVLPPQDTVCRDGDDPYLVVAADKGTASFSDTANAISQSRDFWLDDAFASGGSAGYDHKKMGITARGGWEAVKRHFREMDRNTQKEPFTVIGIGDMSGDVFGNGMLLSEHIKLIAAFDHRDIFIDPDPDAATSFAERKRLFELGRSSWQDYDPSLLSEGGGVYARSSKTIDLSQKAREALDLGTGGLTPQAIMQAILKARADLLWFGGIGTYIRANSESNLDAGDRANDAIRITGKEVRAKVIGEGANLGITHLGRIEYAKHGGRVNTDAIDNSAGVNSSDLEVNIKIALGTLVRAGELNTEKRNEFLVDMTDEVAELCLRNNYLQTLALSLTERQGMGAFPDLATLIQDLETQGHLNRTVEFIPDDATLQERSQNGDNFTRPELSVLLAYAKNTLYADLLNSSVPDDPYLSTELYRYFPEMLKDKYPDTIDNHRLRREVIATVLANAMINRGGITFVHRMMALTSAGPGDVAAAYAAARDSFGLTELNALIDELDTKIKGDTQLALYAEVQTLLVDQTLWFLRHMSFADGLSTIIERYRSGIADIRKKLGTILPKFIAQSVADQAVGFVNGGTPRELARRIAELSALNLATDIVRAADRANADTGETAEAYFAILETFKLGRITEQGNRISLADRYDRMALDRALANLMQAQTDLTCDLLAASDGTITERFKAWHATKPADIDRTIKTVTALTEDELTVSRLSVAAGLLSDLVSK